MADIEITVDSGTSKRLLTGGKYCDKNILVTATGGGGEPEPPDDGKTRLYITVPANSMPDRPPPRNQVPLYIQQTVDRGVTIDWGDGTPTETLAGTGKVNTTHTYEQAGDYVISLDPADGCELRLGRNNASYCIFGSTDNDNAVYRLSLKKAVIGNTGIKKVDSYSFRSCNSLASVIIQYGVEAINSYAFMSCHSLSSITIPKSVNVIGDYGFQYCYCVKEYHILPTTPPTPSSANAFQGIPDDCIIYVPVGSLEAYQTATNWSEYASYMREEGT